MTVCITDTRLIDDSGRLHHGDVVLTDDGSWHLAEAGDAAVERVDGQSLVLTRTLQELRHTHLPMTLQRSWAEGLPLMRSARGLHVPVRTGAHARTRGSRHQGGGGGDDPHRDIVRLRHVLLPGGDRRGDG